MLIKLALRNIRYYAKSYFVYLGTIAFSAFIYYTFFTLVAGEEMQGLQEISSIYRTCFSIGAWMILIFTAVFIWYSTDFFLQKRKQEVGLYFLMGIKKQTVGLILLSETVIMGMAAVIGGIFIGMLAYFPVQQIVSVAFHAGGFATVLLPFSEIRNILFRFLVVFVMLGLVNFRTVKKSELTTLFHAKDASEIPVKTGWVRLVASAAVLIAGFILIFCVKGASNVHFLPIGLGCILAGTFLTFLHSTAMLVKALRKSDRCAKELSVRLNVTSLIHSVRRNAAAWATVALLIAASMSIVILACSTQQSNLEMLAEGAVEDSAVIGIFEVAVLVMVLCAGAFLAATGSMLYFKELSAMQENSRNYRLLYCIGANRSELRRAAARQCRTMFIVPYMAGMVCTVLFTIFISQRNVLNSPIPALIGVALCAVIYLIYYLFAVIYSKQLINKACEGEE